MKARREFRRAMKGLLGSVLVVSGVTIGVSSDVGATTASTSSTLYIANFGSDSVTAYSAADTGNAAPETSSTTGSGPSGEALDATGDLWVADFTSDSLVEYTATSLAAGSPTLRTTITSSSLDEPAGLAFDSTGNLWVVNYEGQSVVEFTRATLVVGGSLTPKVVLTSDDTFDEPYDIAFDKTGNLWVSDFSGRLIEIEEQDLAASGSPKAAVAVTSSGLDGPVGLAFDSAGNVWVANFTGNSVVEFTTTELSTGGTVAPKVTLSSDATDSLGKAADLAFDETGDLWVTAYGHDAIVELTPSQLSVGGSVTPATTIAGTTTGLHTPWGIAIASAASFPKPSITSVSPRAGSVEGGTGVTITGANLTGASAVDFGTDQATIVTDSATSITVTSPAHTAGRVTVTVTTVSGTSSASSADHFTYGGLPSSLYIVNYLNSRLTAFPTSDNGDVPPVGETTSGLDGPVGDVLDAAHDLWVASYSNDAVVEYTAASLSSGTPTVRTTITSDSTESLDGPIGIAFTPTGNLWVSNETNGTVVEYPRATLAAGGALVPKVVLSSNHTFDTPYGITFDSSGDLWVANYDTYGIVEIAKSDLAVTGAPAAAVTITSDVTESADGPITAAFDAAGDLWVTNYLADTVVEFTPGALSTGGAVSPKITLTSDSTDSLDGPLGLAFDAAGDLWVTNDTEDSAVEFTPVELAASGDPTPVATINGTTTGFDEPWGVAIVAGAPTLGTVSPTSGSTSGGTSVTVTGTDLYGATAVHFGSVAATIVSRSATSITVTSPAHAAGSVTVTVTTPGGTSNGEDFTYLEPAPPPPVGAASHTSCSVTSGTCTATNDGVTVTASSGPGALTVSQYSSNPESAPSFTSSGSYFDVDVASGSAFTTVGVKDCNLSSGRVLYWWDPTTSTWETVSPVSGPSGTPPCLTATLSSTSTPTVAELTGTVFAVGTPTAPTGPTAPTAPSAPSATRVYGETADATAAAELTRAFPYTKGTCPRSRAVVLATTKTYQDALSSQFLAQSLTTGTLLTPTESLAAVTAAALKEEGIKIVYVVGGPLAVTTTVAKAIENLTAYGCGGTTRGATTGKLTVTRLAGQTQYGTAMAVAEHVGTAASKAFAAAYATTNATGGTGTYNDTKAKGTAAPTGSVRTAILASGEEFQDAQAASVVSYRTRLPLLLTPSTTLSTTAVGAMEKLGIEQVILMGGTLAVSNSVEAALVAKTGVSVLRVAGTTYTDTADELARFEVAASTSGLHWTPGHRVLVARGNGFTDGLAGAVLDSSHDTATGPAGTVRPLLLTESPTVLGTPLVSFLKTTGHRGIDETTSKTLRGLTVLGGPLAVSTAEVTAIETDLAH